MSVSLREVLGVLRYAEIEVNKWLSLNIADNDTDNADTAWMVLEKIQKAIKKLEKATPTFSGKVIDKTKSVGCNTCEYEERICTVPCTYKKKPTEQKELDLTLEEKVNVLMTIHDDIENLHQIKHKPIPAEKKECEHEWIVPNGMGDVGCVKCGKTKKEPTKPEPKSKDEIESLAPATYTNIKDENVMLALIRFENKLNEIITWINSAEKKECGKVITFTKEALPEICKMLGVPYDKDIIAFTKNGVVKNWLDLILDKPEPKPKDRIEGIKDIELFALLPKEFNANIIIAGRLKDKINEIINFINNRKENGR